MLKISGGKLKPEDGANLDTASVAPNQFNTLACHGLLRALGGVGGPKRRGEGQSLNACSPAVLGDGERLLSGLKIDLPGRRWRMMP